MSELSDFRVVQHAGELAEPSASNGTNGTYGANGHNGTNGLNGVSSASAYNGALANGLEPPAEGVADDSLVAAEAVAFGSAPAVGGAGQLDSWGPDLPEMRIGHASVSSPGIAEAATLSMAAVPARGFDPYARPPRLLRPARLVAGLVLLAGAWLAMTGVLLLGRGLMGGLPTGMDLPLQVGLFAVTALGTAWLALVTLACLATGAFSLSLALRTRGW